MLGHANRLREELEIKGIARLGTLLLVLGVSLTLVSLLRSSPSSGSYGAFLEPGRWTPPPRYTSLPGNLWAPQNLRFEVEADAEVNLYILDEAGISLWEKNGTLAPLFSFENVKQDLYTMHIPKRGAYLFLVHNPSDLALEVKLTYTMYGFEDDLIMAATGSVVLGLVVLVLHKIRSLGSPHARAHL